jgi:hypothetical protein
VRPLIKEIRNKMRNTKNSILAIPAAAIAIAPNPKTAATIAMIRNIADQRSIRPPSEMVFELFRAGEGAFQDEPPLGVPYCLYPPWTIQEFACFLEFERRLLSAINRIFCRCDETPH